MPEHKPGLPTELLDALKRSDESAREARAERIIWLSQHRRTEPGIVLGPMETMTILGEARETFINGHFVATMLLATAFIEHTVSEEVIEAGLATHGVSFAKALDLAEKHNLIPEGLLKRANTLRALRNPLSHRKAPNHQYSLGTRFRQANVHPLAILEQDAMEAIEIMYGFYYATLRIGDPW